MDRNGPTPEETPMDAPQQPSRRRFLQGVAAAGALASGVALATGETQAGDALATLLQSHYLRMTPEEVAAALTRIERRAKREFHAAIRCGNTPPPAGVLFGYALNLSKCVGARYCVSACLKENNGDHGAQYIRVLELTQGSRNLEEADHYFTAETVPRPGKGYLPVQCQHCSDPACVQACPVQATWKEPDGIVVIDYDWCIGCRYCAVACPYWARRFNWKTPALSKEDITAETHYLGNRPRMAGVMEKCTFCLQRTRQGLLPACVEACPTGARIFGNLLDPEGPLRWVLLNRPVFRLKEELKTDPKFWYFTDI